MKETERKSKLGRNKADLVDSTRQDGEVSRRRPGRPATSGGGGVQTSSTAGVTCMVSSGEFAWLRWMDQLCVRARRRPDRGRWERLLVASKRAVAQYIALPSMSEVLLVSGVLWPHSSAMGDVTLVSLLRAAAKSCLFLSRGLSKKSEACGMQPLKHV